MKVDEDSLFAVLGVFLVVIAVVGLVGVTRDWEDPDAEPFETFDQDGFPVVIDPHNPRQVALMVVGLLMILALGISAIVMRSFKAATEPKKNGTH